MSNRLLGVMAGLVPAIDALLEARVDARDKGGHDASKEAALLGGLSKMAMTQRRFLRTASNTGGSQDRFPTNVEAAYRR